MTKKNISQKIKDQFVSPERKDEEIEEVPENIKINFKYFKFLFIFIIIIFLILFQDKSINSNFLFYSFFIFIILAFLFLIVLQSQKTTFFIKKFAEENNLNYKGHEPLDPNNDFFFSLNDPEFIYNVVSGNFKNYPIRLFTYRNKNSKEAYSFIVFEIFLNDFDFPLILLKTKDLPSFYGSDNYSIMKKYDVKINLEKEFDDYFNLYTQRGYGIEVLQIFNYEFLSFLKETSFNYNIELYKDKIYIYSNFIVSGKKQIEEMYQIAEKIFEIIKPTLKNIKNDFNVLHPYFKK